MYDQLKNLNLLDQPISKWRNCDTTDYQYISKSNFNKLLADLAADPSATNLTTFKKTTFQYIYPYIIAKTDIGKQAPSSYTTYKNKGILYIVQSKKSGKIGQKIYALYRRYNGTYNQIEKSKGLPNIATSTSTALIITRLSTTPTASPTAEEGTNFSVLLNDTKELIAQLNFDRTEFAQKIEAYKEVINDLRNEFDAYLIYLRGVIDSKKLKDKQFERNLATTNNFLKKFYDNVARYEELRKDLQGYEKDLSNRYKKYIIEINVKASYIGARYNQIAIASTATTSATKQATYSVTEAKEATRRVNLLERNLTATKAELTNANSRIDRIETLLSQLATRTSLNVPFDL